jgi:hypothetical protein
VAPLARRRPRRRRRGGINAPRIGQTIGGLFGPSGARLGQMAGTMFRNITGVGDYKVQSNSLLSAMDQLPAFKNMSAGTRIQHREYLFDVVTSPTIGAFSIQAIPIQPALLGSFPWLSATAENYQEYRLNGVVYEFKSNSYDALSSTNTASGTVVMATDYNVLDPTFVNKFQMEQTQFTCSGKPSIDLLHPIECSKIETPTNILYTRPGPVTTGDLRLYDWGNFYIATVGMQGRSTNIGELWVTYDISLLKPKLTSTVDVYDHWELPVGHFAPGGSQYFGTTIFPPVLTSDSDLGTTLFDTLSPGNLDTIVFPPGYTGKVAIIYRASLASVATAPLATPYHLSFNGGASPIFGFGGGTSSNNEQNGSLGGPLLYSSYGGCTFVQFVDLNNGGNIVFGGGTSATALLSGDLFVVALPSNFATSPLLSASSSLTSPLRLRTDESEKKVRSVTPEQFEVVESIPVTSFSKPVLSRQPTRTPTPNPRSV